MLIDVLRATLRAAMITLRTTTGLEARIAASDMNTLAASDLRLLAAISPARGPVRSLWVGCDQVLARALTERLHPTGPITTLGARASAAFRVFCGIFQQNLAAEAREYVPSEDVLYFGPGRVPVQPQGDRLFQIHASVGPGKLIVVLALQLDQDLARARDASTPVGMVAEGKHEYALRGTALDAVFAGLDRQEIDVQIEVPASHYLTEIRYAAIVGCAQHKGNRVLEVFASHANDPAHPWESGAGILIFLVNDGRLYQFRTQVVEGASKAIDEGAGIPVLTVAYPTELVPGQRRRTYRVEPVDPMSAFVERWIVDDNGVYETEGRTGCQVRDVSQGGACFVSTDPELLMRFPVHGLVVCTVQLTRQTKEIRVPAIVRRARRVGRDGTDHYEIGVEFLANPTWKDYSVDLERLRAWVQSEQLRAGRGGARS